MKQKTIVSTGLSRQGAQYANHKKEYCEKKYIEYEEMYRLA